MSKNKMLIGPLKINPPLALAPMAGVSNLPFRLLCKEEGCGLLFSEMISARGLIYGSTKESLLSFHGKERPFAYQLFGSKASDLAEGARVIEERDPDIIDINMGCPVNKVVKEGAGAALLQDPQKAFKIIKAIVNAVKIPVTVKIRKGWTLGDELGLQVALLAQEAGAAAVTVHGRSREQMYTGSADWSFIHKVAQELDIPVIGNGDIFTYYDINNALKYTCCAGVMIGRGAWGNPWIFRQGSRYLTGKLLKNNICPTNKERIVMAKKHLDLMIKFRGEKMGVLEMRRHCGYYLKTLPGAAAARQRIYKAQTSGDIENILDEYISRFTNFSL